MRFESPTTTAKARSSAAIFAALIASLTLLVGEATAMYARLTEQELIQRSDLIVTGTLIGTTRVRSGSFDATLGVIRVEETLAGADATVVLLAVPGPGQPVSSSDVAFPVGTTGLWYLRLRSPSESGIYLADHPQRFVPAAEAGKALESLRRLRAAKTP